MKKKLLEVATTFLITTLTWSCGGGGGGDINTSSTSQTGADVITTQVVASYVKGAKVCIEGTERCAITDDTGVAVISGAKPPVRLEISLGKIPLGEVEANDNTEIITPEDLANGDETVAQLIEDIIHSLGKVQGEIVDVSHLKAQVSKPLAELIKEALKEKKEVSLEVDEHKLEIDPNQKVVIVDNEEVEHHPLPKPETLSESEKALELLHHFAEFLTKANGKCIAFYDKEADGDICKLEINPQNPLEFKLTQCENPEDNDNNYEKTYIKDGKVIVVDEDGEGAEITKVEDNKIYYRYKDAQGNSIEGYITLTSTCHEPASGYGYEEESETSSGYGYEASSGYSSSAVKSSVFFPEDINQVIQFFKDNEGKEVKTSDGGSCLVEKVEEEGNRYLVNLVSCENTEFKDGEREIYKDENGKILVELPTGKTKVYVYADDTAVCTDESCLYSNPEPNEDTIKPLMKAWINYNVDPESKTLVPEFCVEFRNGKLYAKDLEKNTELVKVATYTISGNTINIQPLDEDFDIRKLQIFKIAKTEEGIYIASYAIYNDDEDLELFKAVDSCP